MFIRKYWLPLTVFIVAIVSVSLYWLQTRPPKAPIAIIKPVEVEQPKAEAPVGKTPQGGHVHEDGTFHAKPHETPEPKEVSPQETYKPPPGAVTTPDFPPVDPNEDPVKAAYKRLNYIKNNPYAWGGVHSPRATELISELMPPPVIMDHAHGEQLIALINELEAQGDPRAAEVYIATIRKGYMGSGGHEFIAIGPPAVPYLLSYLEEGMVQGGTMSIGVFRALAGIGERYRSDLGGIVEHLIIPKLELIAADNNDEDFDEKYARFSASVIFAREALARLQ